MNLSTYGEPIEIDRAGQALFSLSGGIDPAASKLYLDAGTDIAQGDIATFRGIVRRIVEIPEVWLSPFTGWAAGVVATYEDAPAFLPDLAMLYRPNGTTVFDRETNTTTPGYDLIWTGPCSADPTASLGNAPDDADQIVGVQPFTVLVPLDLIDVEPDDEIEVYDSRDGRLVLRRLVVTAIGASSTALLRTIAALDNQG